jgi:membrane-associated phospholipid phosphatase
MPWIIMLQALEPRDFFRLLFSLITWCGDGPVSVLLFPLLYWRKSPAVAIRYGYLWCLLALVVTVLKAQTETLRPFLAAPEHVALLKYPVEGFHWFPSQASLIEAYRHNSSFPSGHALFAVALGLYLCMHTASRSWRCILVCFMVMIPLSRVYLGVHYPVDVLAGSGLGVLFALLAMHCRWESLASQLPLGKLPGWQQRLLLVGALVGVCTLHSKAAVFVVLVLLSYAVILTSAARPIRYFSGQSTAAWHTWNAVGGCLGVAIILWAMAPLLGLGSLLSVPAVTLWVTLGGPLLVQCLRPSLRPASPGRQSPPPGVPRGSPSHSPEDRR